MVHKIHPKFSGANQKNFLGKQSTYIKRDEINIMDIINDNALNLHKTF